MSVIVYSSQYPFFFLLLSVPKILTAITLNRWTFLRGPSKPSHVLHSSSPLHAGAPRVGPSPHKVLKQNRLTPPRVRMRRTGCRWHCVCTPMLPVLWAPAVYERRMVEPLEETSRDTRSALRRSYRYGTFGFRHAGTVLPVEARATYGGGERAACSGGERVALARSVTFLYTHCA